jgi:hypothetical protein
MTQQTKRDLLTYALIGAAATPIALAGGELLAAVFCVVSTVIAGISRKRT